MKSPMAIVTTYDTMRFISERGFSSPEVDPPLVNASATLAIIIAMVGRMRPAMNEEIVPITNKTLSVDLM